MRPLMTAAIAALVIGPAYGQSGQPPAFDVPVGTPSKNQEEKEKLKAKDIDADYNAAMKRSRVTTPKVVSESLAKREDSQPKQRQELALLYISRYQEAGGILMEFVPCGMRFVNGQLVLMMLITGSLALSEFV